MELFKAKVSVAEHFGRSIGTDLGMVKSEYQHFVVEPYAPTYVKKRIVTAAESDKYLGMVMLCLVYCSQFGELLSGIQTD